MYEPLPDSDCEVGSDMLNSSQSSTSDSCSSLSRLSFEASEIPVKSPGPSPGISSIKPHKRLDSAWDAIRSLIFRQGRLNFKDFRLVRRLGSGDIGNVYLCQLRSYGSNCLYAMKVVDKQALALKKKLHRAETEKKILSMLDHPFLPTLYADFEASHFSCVVMEFCSGGDLHNLRHKQQRKRFSISSARFYAAEVLLALEYLHMLGIIYRDLKPENVLVRSDGHIMLSDFDLSLKCNADPSVESPETFPENASSHISSNVSCFPHWLFRSRKVSRAGKRQFVAEPVGARSSSFVGTHEYVSPEVAAGKSHGSAVDWWAFGVFLYELIYGRTPFSGESNEVTLKNILKKPLTFPSEKRVSPASQSENYAKNLISGLLVKDPTKRLGSKRGAADIKTHPFFKGLNFALIRSNTPPEIPGFRRTKTCFERKPANFDFF